MTFVSDFKLLITALKLTQLTFKSTVLLQYPMFLNGNTSKMFILKRIEQKNAYIFTQKNIILHLLGFRSIDFYALEKINIQKLIVYFLWWKVQIRLTNFPGIKLTFLLCSMNFYIEEVFLESDTWHHTAYSRYPIIFLHCCYLSKYITKWKCFSLLPENLVPSEYKTHRAKNTWKRERQKNQKGKFISINTELMI